MQTFFDFAKQYLFVLNERNAYIQQRLHAESQTVNDIQFELNESLQNIVNLGNEMTEVTSDAHHRIALLKFQSIVHRANLKSKLEDSLHAEEQTAQQNNILLSQMSAMQNQHSVFNPVHWDKVSWCSFAIGVVVSEQAIEQFTNYKPIRGFVSRGIKKVLGKSDSQKKLVPASFKPAMAGEYEAHVSVPVIPVVQVHN